MTGFPRKAFVVSHTHWDREWYLTYHEFRTLLVRAVRRAMDALERDPSFRHFALDGQAVVLEDYLEIHPEDRQRIERLVRGGALSVGPWYVLPDEFLVSGEALVRNLLIGHKVAGEFGRVQKVGYLPDSFGHVAQLPQILRRAGIDSFIYTRGSGDELGDLGLEYLWRAPDGSEVLAVNQCGGYCNAGGLGHEEIWHAHTRREVNVGRAVEQVRAVFARMAGRSNGDVWLLNNGCDHFPPQAKLGEILEALRGAFPGTEFVHAGFEEFVAEVRRSGAARKSWSGELVSGKEHPILTGVWSARMYLKQENDRAQGLLADCLEPLSAYAHFVLGREYPSGAIEYAWKELLKNHPHDSICGCSTDAVHRDMIPRFAAARETAEQILRLELEHIAPTFARRAGDDRETVIVVANPLPVRRTEVVTRLVVLQPPGADVARLELRDAAGRTVPMTVMESRRIERFWGIDYRTALSYDAQRTVFDGYLRDFGPRIVRTDEEREKSDQFITIQFVAADLPAVGHACYYLVEGEGGARTAAMGAVTAAADSIENEHCSVTLHPDGTFDVRHKASGRAFRRLNLLEDTEDVGDEYDHSPAGESRTVTSEGAAGVVRVVECTGLAGRLEAAFALRLPAAIGPGRASRSTETVDCPVVARVGLKKGSPLVDVEILFENRALDHRLRAVFPTGIAARSVVSDGHFHANVRPVDVPERPDWLQPPTGTVPQQEFSLVEDGEAGLAVFSAGLPEVQASRDRGGRVALALTLLRGVGWLSRDDLRTRRMNAGPTIPTPDAQCAGPRAFRYAVLPYTGGWVSAGVKRASRLWRTPVLAVQGVRDLHVPGGEGLVCATGEAVCVTAVKKHEARDTLVVRLVNLTADRVKETLTLGRDVVHAWRTDLLEERVGEIPAGMRDVFVEMGPHEILTVELELRQAGG
jgi:alpha-mannosidase